MRWRVSLVLILLGSLVVLVPLAHASPPDPMWIGGLYDAADYDEVVLAVTSTDSVPEDILPAVLRFFPIVTGFIPRIEVARATAATFQALQIRAPPIP